MTSILSFSEWELADILKDLPKNTNLERDISLASAEKNGIAVCGDEDKKGRKIYKLLTSSGEMLTYHKENSMLIYDCTCKVF